MSARADLIQKLMNKKRKAEVKVDQEVVVIEEKKIKQGEASTSKQEEDDEEKRKQEEEQKNKDLYNKAKEKVLFEAKRAKERADEHGPQGWLRPNSLATNKQFLRRTLQSTLPRTKRQTKELPTDKF